MNSMFKECQLLEKLDLSNFETNEVTNMNFMFNGCSSLKVLNLSNFKFKNTTSVVCMFGLCSEELKKSIRNIYKCLNQNAFNNYPFDGFIMF